jgi:probable HAF family extracellular repeat protein
MNGRGQVVGESETADGRVRAFLGQEGKMADLGTLGGRNSIALAINDRGQVAGGADARSGKEHAFLWQDGRTTDLGTLGRAYPTSRALAINASGQVSGASYGTKVTQTGVLSQAFLWQNGAMRRLDVSRLGDENSSGMVIDDAGEVAGIGDDGHGGFHPFLWRRGTASDLPKLGAGYADIAGINVHGLVVGTSVPPKGGTVHAVVWQDGRVTDLGTLGGDQSSADAVSSRGWVVGAAWLKNGHRRGVLWTQH